MLIERAATLIAGQSLVSDVLGDHRLADAVRPTSTTLAASLRNSSAFSVSMAAVATLGPGPVEVAERLEAADMGGAQSSLQAAAGAFVFLPTEQ
jgi:hypothetical protein